MARVSPHVKFGGKKGYNLNKGSDSRIKRHAHTPSTSIPAKRMMRPRTSRPAKKRAW